MFWVERSGELNETDSKYFGDLKVPRRFWCGWDRWWWKLYEWVCKGAEFWQGEEKGIAKERILTNGMDLKKVLWEIWMNYLLKVCDAWAGSCIIYKPSSFAESMMSCILSVVWDCPQGGNLPVEQEGMYRRHATNCICRLRWGIRREGFCVSDPGGRDDCKKQLCNHS